MSDHVCFCGHDVSFSCKPEDVLQSSPSSAHANSSSLIGPILLPFTLFSPPKSSKKCCVSLVQSIPLLKRFTGSKSRSRNIFISSGSEPARNLRTIAIRVPAADFPCVLLPVLFLIRPYKILSISIKTQLDSFFRSHHHTYRWLQDIGLADFFLRTTAEP